MMDGGVMLSLVCSERDLRVGLVVLEFRWRVV